MKNKKKSKNSDGEKGYENRKTEIKAEERNAEDLPSGSAANFRVFGLFQNCNRNSFSME